MATKVTRPYFDFTNTNDSSEAPYRGYAVDLIDAIFKIVNKDHNLNWEYEFYAVQKTGNPIPGSKKWDGLLGDVMEHVSLIIRTYFKLATRPWLRPSGSAYVVNSTNQAQCEYKLFLNLFRHQINSSKPVEPISSFPLSSTFCHYFLFIRIEFPDIFF